MCSRRSFSGRRRISRIQVYSQPGSAQSFGNGCGGAGTYERVDDNAVFRRKEANHPLGKDFGKFGLVATIAANRRYFPDAARTPFGPFRGGQPIPFVGNDARFPVDVEILEFIDGTI